MTCWELRIIATGSQISELNSLLGGIICSVCGYMDSGGGQSVPVVPIPAKDQRAVSGGLMGCQHFDEFTIVLMSGSIILKTNVSLE